MTIQQVLKAADSQQKSLGGGRRHGQYAGRRDFWRREVCSKRPLSLSLDALGSGWLRVVVLLIVTVWFLNLFGCEYPHDFGGEFCFITVSGMEDRDQYSEKVKCRERLGAKVRIWSLSWHCSNGSVRY